MFKVMNIYIKDIIVSCISVCLIKIGVILSPIRVRSRESGCLILKGLLTLFDLDSIRSLFSLSCHCSLLLSFYSEISQDDVSYFC